MEKKYLIDNKELIKEWDWKENQKIGLNPKELFMQSNKKAYWICNNGHKYKSSIAHRTNGSKCPYCSNRKLLRGYNDLATTNPDIVKEWDYEKNKNIYPENFFSGSHQKVWWKCKRGHSWQVSINSKVKDKTGCPYCSNRKILLGYNDLVTINLKLSEEWDYEKNNGLTPQMFMIGSHQKVWWKCNKGHSWQATIYSRKSRGCPICRYEAQTSFNEQCIYFYLSKFFDDCETRKKINNIEIDIYIKSLNLGIEYDGENWHKDIKKDMNKINTLKRLGISLINIREPNCPKLENKYIYQLNSLKETEMEDAINYIINLINDNYNMNLKINPNISKDRIAIMELYVNSEKELSLGIKNPELASEWNYEKNGKITPFDVKVNSMKRVWWKCINGHEWEASIAARNNVGTNCPYCSNRKVLQGYNDLATIRPDLLKEWDYEKNNSLTPQMFTYGSNSKVWWKCDKGHSWQASIYTRYSNHSCPYCSNKKVLRGFNDFQTKYPQIAKEFDIEKNNMFPCEISPFSNKKVWWKCSKCGYEWQYSIAHRSNGYGKCPNCKKMNENL